MSKKDIRPQGAEGISHSRNVAKACGQVNDQAMIFNRQDLVRANTALSDISEISLRGRALLDVMTGSGFSYFSQLNDDLQEALLHQAFMLVAEINNAAVAALDEQTGGAA